MTLQESVETPYGSFGRFFQEVGEGTVALPHCLDCDRYHWYPMQRCPHCYSDRLEWAPVSARGTVFAVTTVRYAFTSRTRGSTPYGIALVTLLEVPDIRIVCRTEATPESGSLIRIGDAVLIEVDPDADDPETGFVRCVAVADA